MNILLVTDSYPPEIRSASHLMQELAEGLRDKRHKVTVITTYPQYNLAPDSGNISFPEFSREKEIDVIRVRTMPHHKINFVVRGISQLTMPHIFLSRLNTYVRDRIHTVVVYSPPLPLASVGASIKRKHGARFILNVQDIFPQNAVDLGILKNRLAIKFFERQERAAYKSADRIAVHSEGNRDFLHHGKGVPQEKLCILHNWIDTSVFTAGVGNGRFRKRYGLENKFIFLFGGIMGPSQGLDLIVKAAQIVKDSRDIQFLLAGDGMEKERLMKAVRESSLKNITFLPFVSKEDYPALVKEADVGLVCLSSMNKTPVVPGKILGYMAASKPVAAFLNKESDGHRIITYARCGYSAVSDDADKAAELIKRIYAERSALAEYGLNGFTYVRNNFSRDICIAQLEKLF